MREPCWSAPPATVVGLIVLQNYWMQAAHIVAIDEVGVLDPSDGLPDHMAWSTYCNQRQRQGFIFESDFLVVTM